MKYIQPDWPAPREIKAYTTLRSGWGGRRSHHEESQSLEKLLQLPDEPIWLKQVHGSLPIEALPENREKSADASFTEQKNRVCVVLTADCLPILLCHQKATHVAAIHAGWRGLSGGIIEATVNSLAQPPQDLLAWLGPAIGPQKFEVGKEVFDAFVSLHSESASAFVPYKEDKWLANLYELARIRLRLLGISQIFGGDYCTYTQDDLFFSYRRDQKKPGRMASLIWISGN